MAMTVKDILADADAFRRAYPGWPHAEPEKPASLESRLSAWIDAEQITGNYDTAGIAARLVKAIHPETLERWLTSNPDLLADRCRRIKDDADLTPVEWLMEDHLHGHGDKPRRTRRGNGVD